MVNTLRKKPASPLTIDAFADAYSKGFPLTVRFLLSKGANFDQAEELAQNAWVRGWEARAQLRLADRVLPWVNSIAYHRFCNDRRRAPAVELTDPATSGIPSDTAMDAGIVLKLCTPVEQGLLTQRYIQGMEVKEIAEARGLSEIAVRVRLHRCQRNLRARLRRGRARLNLVQTLTPFCRPPSGYDVQSCAA